MRSRCHHGRCRGKSSGLSSMPSWSSSAMSVRLLKTTTAVKLTHMHARTGRTHPRPHLTVSLKAGEAPLYSSPVATMRSELCTQLRASPQVTTRARHLRLWRRSLQQYPDASLHLCTCILGRIHCSKASLGTSGREWQYSCFRRMCIGDGSSRDYLVLHQYQSVSGQYGEWRVAR